VDLAILEEHLREFQASLPTEEVDHPTEEVTQPSLLTEEAGLLTEEVNHPTEEVTQASLLTEEAIMVLGVHQLVDPATTPAHLNLVRPSISLPLELPTVLTKVVGPIILLQGMFLLFPALDQDHLAHQTLALQILVDLLHPLSIALTNHHRRLDRDPVPEMATTLHLLPDHLLQVVPSRQRMDPQDPDLLLQVVHSRHLLANPMVETMVRQTLNLHPILDHPQAAPSPHKVKALETTVQLDLFPQVGSLVDHSHPLVANLLVATNNLDNHSQVVPPAANQPIPDHPRRFLREVAASQ